MPTRTQIKQRLREDVELYRAAYEASTKRFTEIFSDVPSGLPHPDGVKQIEKVAKERRVAMRNLEGAVRRLSDFLVSMPGTEAERKNR